MLRQQFQCAMATALLYSMQKWKFMHVEIKWGGPSIFGANAIFNRYTPQEC